MGPAHANGCLSPTLDDVGKGSQVVEQHIGVQFSKEGFGRIASGDGDGSCANTFSCQNILRAIADHHQFLGVDAQLFGDES